LQFENELSSRQTKDKPKTARAISTMLASKTAALAGCTRIATGASQ
jgi:hypothetical protein